MGRIRFLTAGESHGPALIGILEGIPAGLRIDKDRIDHELRRRQHGHGRGGRMRIERDTVRFLGGLRWGRTLGGPIAVMIENRDWVNWQAVMDPLHPSEGVPPATVPRPGHADLVGILKYGHTDLRDVIERSSARETAMRVALGAIAKQLLAICGITIASHVVQIHDVRAQVDPIQTGWDAATINARADASPVRCLDPDAEKAMVARIDTGRSRGDTVGGVFEVIAFDVPAGLGSYVHWDRRLDARIAMAMMSIQAMKGVEIGGGFDTARRWGSEVQDEIFYTPDRGYYRSSNRAGGIEGGVSNGAPIVVRVAMKPLSTLMQPLRSVDIRTKEPAKAHRERSDVCAVPAASIVGEAMLALTLTDALLEKFGGDSVDELVHRVEQWRERTRGG